MLEMASTILQTSFHISSFIYKSYLFFLSDGDYCFLEFWESVGILFVCIIILLLHLISNGELQLQETLVATYSLQLIFNQMHHAADQQTLHLRAL
jgi:heme exporter protein D